MLVTRIAAKPDTNIELEITRLRELGILHEISSSTLEGILAGVKSTLEDFLARGRKIDFTGSQIAFSRSISGDEFRIELSYDNKAKKGLLSRLLHYIRE